MTWVIGASPVIGGYAVMISDTQVTFGDGQTADLVRKAYPVGPFLLGGFAGSVQLGFQLLQSISEFLALDDGEQGAWIPEYVAEHWAPIAKAVFDQAPQQQRQLGAQFILAGPHPQNDIIPGRATPYVVTFTFPAFQPEIFAGGHVVRSIGSGAHVPQYRDGIRELLNPQAGLMQAEVGTVGGWANALKIGVSFVLEDTPVDGISPHAHVQLAARGEFRLDTNDRTTYPSDGPPIEFIMGNVAQSWGEFVQMAHALQADAASATC